MKFDLQRIPRYVIYLVLLACLAVPYFVQWTLPVYVSKATRELYGAVERVHAASPARPVVLLSCWDPSSRGENRPQLLALVRHLLVLRQPFVIFCPTMNPMAPRASEEVLECELKRAKLEWEAGTNVPFVCTYGVDYANLGFKGISGPNIGPILQNLEGDFQGCVVRDLYGTPVGELPMVRDFKSLADASMIITVSGDIEAEHVIGIFSPRHPEIPVGAAGWSLICTRLYPYFDTRQLVGILDGMNGASEYLTLLEEHYPSRLPAAEGTEVGSSKRVNALTLARVLIIGLIVLGNIGMVLERRRRRLGLSEPAAAVAAPVSEGESRVLNIGAAVFTVLFVAAMIAEYVVRSRAGMWSVGVAGQWVAVFCTIGTLSFIFGDNKLYRILESVIIGSSAAYTLYELIDKQIIPSFAHKVAEGFAALAGGGSLFSGQGWQVLLLLGVIPSLLWFTVYVKSLAWTNKLVLGLLMGVGVGIAFGQNVNLAVPQIAGAIKPLLTFESGGRHVQDFIWRLGDSVCLTWDNVFNLVYLVTLVLVMWYFVFCLAYKTAVAKGAVKAGRIVMMIAFGAVFGNTIATRMSWLIDRIDAVAAWAGSLMILGGGK